MRLSLLFFALSLATSPQAALADDAWQLTTDGGRHPTWSPDGSQIAFVSHRSGNADIWIIDVSTIAVEPTTWGAIKASFK
jgi:Tol biopolymer transport system component